MLTLILPTAPEIFPPKLLRSAGAGMGPDGVHFTEHRQEASNFHLPDAVVCSECLPCLRVLADRLSNKRDEPEAHGEHGTSLRPVPDPCLGYHSFGVFLKYGVRIFLLS